MVQASQEIMARSQHISQPNMSNSHHHNSHHHNSMATSKVIVLNCVPYITRVICNFNLMIKKIKKQFDNFIRFCFNQDQEYYSWENISSNKLLLQRLLLFV